MNLELFSKDLEEITEKINKLELQEAKDNYKSSWWMYGNAWPDKKTCWERKAGWKTLETKIKRLIELIKRITSESEEKDNYTVLLSRLTNKLSKVEEKIANLEARLTDLKDREEKSKIGNYFLMIIIIIILIFFLYLIATDNLSKVFG